MKYQNISDSFILLISEVKYWRTLLFWHGWWMLKLSEAFSNFSGCKRGWIVLKNVHILSTAPSSPNSYNFWGTGRKMVVFVAFFPSLPPDCHQMGCFLHLRAVLSLFQVYIYGSGGDGERQGCFFFFFLLLFSRCCTSFLPLLQNSELLSSSSYICMLILAVAFKNFGEPSLFIIFHSQCLAGVKWWHFNWCLVYFKSSFPCIREI